MTKRLKIFLLTILAAVCAACVFAGCKVGPADREETLAPYKGNVVYYANGGYFNGSTSINVINVYFKNDPGAEGYNPNGVPFFDITDETSSMKVERTGYDLQGWFIPEKYESGAHAGEAKYTYTYKENETDKVSKTVPVYPLKDADGNYVHNFSNDRPVFARETEDGKFVDEQIAESAVEVVPSNELLTSSRLIGDDEVLTVCAKWKPSLKVQYILVCDEDKKDAKYKDADGNEYGDGDIIREDNFGKGETYSPTSLEPIKLKGASFMRTYSNPELTTQIGPLNRPAGENPEDIKIYCRYKDGDWTVIGNDTSAIRRMFQTLSRGGNYYLMEDVDCSKISINLNTTAVATAKIEGNNKTISNLNFVVSGGMAQVGMTYSIFGELGETFEVNDLTLQGVNIKIDRNRDSYSLYAICNGAHANAKFNNVKMNDITANVKLASGTFLYNAQNGNKSHWLFGGATNDEAFLAAHAGLTVDGKDLIIE